MSNILSEDITNLNGLTTETVATILEAVLGIAAGVGISAFFEWRMSLVCILATPFVLVGGMIMARLNYKTGASGKNRNDPNTKIEDPYAESNALLADVIMNYRTVISFGQHNIDAIMEKYERLLDGPANKRVFNAHIAGVAFGYSVCVRFIYIGVVFYIGAVFAEKYNLNFKYVF